jgi:predicted metalloendopeptidase
MVASLLLLCFSTVRKVTAQTSTKISHLDKSVMDTSADPCSDFYKYACGNYKKIHPLRDGEDYVFLSDLERTDALDQIAHLLEQPEAALKADGPDAEHMRTFFQACMDQKEIDRAGLEPISQVTNAIAGYQHPSEMASLLVALTAIKANPFFTIQSIPSQSRPRRLMLSLGEPRLGLPSSGLYTRDGESDRQTRKTYKAHIISVLELEGQTGADAALNADRVLQVETAIAKSRRSAVEDRDPSAHTHTSTVTDLQQTVPLFGWKTFFTALSVHDPGVIAVENPATLETFQGLLATADAETLRAYILFRTIESIPRVFQATKLAAEDRAFSAAVGGAPSNASRTHGCLLQVLRARPEDAERLYVKHFVAPELKGQALEMLEGIEQQFALEVKDADWLSASTRQNAASKLKQVSNIVAYDAMKQTYESVPVLPDKALENYLQATRFKTHIDLERAGKPVDRNESQFMAVYTGAAYNPERNSIDIPAAQLTPPDFDLNAYDAENYARDGFVMGHELIHGYDDKGRLYDSEGYLKNWWTDDDARAFSDKATCFVKEYEQFGIDDQHHINGSLTLGENIADNGGLHLSMLAYLARAKSEGIDVNRPEDGITPLQRFFLTYAQDSCSAVRPESERLQLENNPHSLDRFRANGVLQNLREFGRAFSCKPGQPMMPEHPCEI